VTSPRAMAEQYQQSQVATADRGKLLLLMFDGARRFLARAESALTRGDLAGFATSLARGQAVIAELMHTLDHERGGEVATNLEQLYRFMLDHLVDANVQKSPAHVARVSGLLGTIAGAFGEVLQKGTPRLDAV
jgi:flagellar secretion chaperone FliS